MRIIKFRYWNAEDKIMTDGDALGFEEYLPITQHLSQEGIMQYTGLKDKNGKEIYEGDVVRWFDRTAEVFFNDHHNGSFQVRFIDDDKMMFMYPKQFEVIGNIYENPELLEESK